MPPPSNAEDTCRKNHPPPYGQVTETQWTDKEWDEKEAEEEKYEAKWDTAAWQEKEACIVTEKGYLGPAQPVPALLAGDHSAAASLVQILPSQEKKEADEAGAPAESVSDHFPEGGLEAWLVVLGSFCAMMIVFGLINTAAVFESWFATHQLADRSASDIGWIFSLYLFVVFFVGIQVGPIFDTYGPRILVAVGSVLVVASLMLLSLCEEYYQILLCYSVLGGLGGSLLNSPAYGCIAHFFNTRRGLATGIATTAGGIGGIVFPLLLQELLPLLGFAWTARLLALILLALAIPANLWIRARLPLAPRASRPCSVWPDLGILRDRRYAAAAAGVFFMEWGLFVPITFIVSYAAAHGRDPNDSYTLLALLNAGSVLGRFVPGLLSDRLGRFNVIIMTIALSAAAVLALWLPAARSPRLLVAFAVLFGFASGSNLGLIAVCLGQLCEPRDYGRYLGTAMTLASCGTLSSLPIAGALIALGMPDSPDAGWSAAIVFSGLAYLLALVCYLAARIFAVGPRPTAIF